MQCVIRIGFPVSPYQIMYQTTRVQRILEKIFLENGQLLAHTEQVINNRP